MNRVLRVLQVEDSPDDAELVCMELRRGGYELEAHRIESSTSMVSALLEQDWDLVLSDFELPGFGGMKALQILQTSGIDIPFIVVSGAIGEEIAVASMKAGAHDYVFKGNLARLGPAVTRELQDANTRRKQRDATTNLRYMQGSLEQAQSLAHIGSWEWDTNQQHLHWSPELYRIFGLEPSTDRPSYDRFTDMVHPEDRALVLGTLEAVIAEGNRIGIDYRICRKDGEVRHVHELAELVPGHPPRLRGTIQDITERKQAQSALQAAKDELESFFSLIPDLACVASTSGYFLKLNPAWKECLGYSEEEMLNRPFTEFLHPNDIESTLREVEMRSTGSGTHHFINRYRAKDGSY